MIKRCMLTLSLWLISTVCYADIFLITFVCDSNITYTTAYDMDLKPNETQSAATKRAIETMVQYIRQYRSRPDFFFSAYLHDKPVMVAIDAKSVKQIEIRPLDAKADVSLNKYKPKFREYKSNRAGSSLY